MVEDAEIAELTQYMPAPTPGGMGRRASLLLAALALAASLVAGLILWTPTAPAVSSDLIGLSTAPSPAWSLSLADNESAVGVGATLVAVQSRHLVNGRARIRVLAADSGRELWRLGVDGDAGPVTVYDLPGTAWLAARTGGTVRILDKGDGSEVTRLRLPDERAWFGSSDRGTLLVAVPDGDRLRVSRLGGPDLAAVTWTSEVSLTPGATLGIHQCEIVERDGLLLVRSRDGWRGSLRYSLALDAATGAQPRWSTASDRFVVAGHVAVYSADTVVAGHDLASGRRLWRLSPAAAGLLATGDVLLAESMGELRRLDPYTGRTQWSTPSREAFTDLIVDRGRLIRYAGAQTQFPEFGTTKADSPQRWVDALDLTTGRPLWRVGTPSPVLDVLVATDLLVVRMFDPTAEHPSFEVAGIDQGRGDLVWRWRDEHDSWALIRLGPRLATYSPSGTLTVWG